MQSEVNQEENLNRIITVPNLLSFFRLCLIPVIIWSYCVKKNPLLAGEILLLSGLTDLADGYIARRFHRISNLGKILDPVADKLTQAAMLICLFTRFPHVLLLIVIMAGKELYMVVSGCLVIRKTGKVHGADWHGKIVTFLLYGTAAVHFPHCILGFYRCNINAENDIRHLLEQRRHKIIAQLLRILRNRHRLGKSVVYFRVLGCKAHRIGCNRVAEIVAQFSVVIKAELKAPFLAAAKKVVQHLQSFIVCHWFDCTAQIGKLRQKVALHLPQTAAGIGDILFVGG